MQSHSTVHSHGTSALERLRKRIVPRLSKEMPKTEQRASDLCVSLIHKFYGFLLSKKNEGFHNY